MDAALTPELALDYLRELSADVRAGVVLDGTGARLAGPAPLVDAAVAVLAALGPGCEGRALRADGTVFAVRGGAVAIVLVCGPQALPGLARHDLRLVLADLGVDDASAGGGAAELPVEPVERLLTAAQRGAGGP